MALTAKFIVRFDFLSTKTERRPKEKSAMSHQSSDKMIQDLASQTRGNPRRFLNGFSPIHVIWHTRRGVVVDQQLLPVGFLTFHHSAITAYAKVLRSVDDRLPAPWGPDYDPTIDEISDSVEFSRAIERWHNGVHNNDMSLMNPATNIRRPKFWALHNFINRKFAAWQRRHRKLTSAEHQTV